MLLWLNGPFGGGKTQTAHELRRRLPGSIICDPESVGVGLHRMMPPVLRGDFQDLAAWRHGVYEVLDLVSSSEPGPVIVPMTIIDPGCFAETVVRLRERGHDVRHFAVSKLDCAWPAFGSPSSPSTSPTPWGCRSPRTETAGCGAG